MKKSKFYAIFTVTLVLLLSIAVSAHQGKTDGNGGHIDHSTGQYHYHHGKPAHLHNDTNGDGITDCPYNFEDSTGTNSGGQSSGGSSSGSSSGGSLSSSKPAGSVTTSAKKSGSNYGWVALVILCGFYVVVLAEPFFFRLKRKKSKVSTELKLQASEQSSEVLNEQICQEKPLSSFITEASYKGNTLYLTFSSGITYAYQNVPRAVYEGLLQAPSKGAYFHKNISGVYPYYIVGQS